MVKESENSYRKIKRSSEEMHIQTHANLRYFDDHRCLSWSEESKFMWTHSKDGHDGLYVYSITCLLILITSPPTILNLPINLFCPLDTSLVLTSDNFYFIFPRSPPLFHPSCLVTSLVALSKTLTWRHLYCVFTYIYSVLIKKEICDCRNISIKFLRVFPLEISSIFGKSFLLSFSVFCAIHILVLSFPRGL